MEVHNSFDDVEGGFKKILDNVGITRIGAEGRDDVSVGTLSAPEDFLGVTAGVLGGG